MELDDLKTRWQQDTQIHTNSHQKDMKQLEAILQGKTSSLVTLLHQKYERIITSLMIGMGIYLVGVPLITGTPYAESAKLYIPYFALVIPLLLFYWLTFRRISGSVTSDQLQNRLNQLIKKLRRSRWQEMLLIAVAAIGLGGWRFAFGKGMTDILKPEVVIGYPLMIAFTGGLLLYTYRRYGRYIRELQEYQAEFEEQEKQP